MSKDIKKETQQTRRYNPTVVDRICKKHGLSKYYIRQCIRGERTSETADTIRKDYKRMLKEMQNTLNNL